MNRKKGATRFRLWLLVILSTFPFLTGSCVPADDPPPQAPASGTEKEPSEKPDDEKPDAGDTIPTIRLSADGVTDTHTLISSKGFNPEEDPYYFPENHPGVKHITQVFDEVLNKWVFAFTIHVNPDRDKNTTATDRQRVEIKTDDKSPANMKGAFGETHAYRWKFKLPIGMQPTKEFCHIFQIKPAGGDDDTPMNTLTVRKLSNGTEQVELIHVKGKDVDANQSNNTFAVVPLSDFLGEWVEVNVKATFTDTGAYSCKVVRLRDSKVLINYTTSSMDLWRVGTNIVRPKYGIYRSIGQNGSLKSQLRDETLLFADFELTETPSGK